ncbi:MULTISPECIES: ATP-binding protein [unclassified Nodularia (in: cyanobacteria)]|uniref:GAF domain-containing sensor histidine kinase n=1 Tax=unclassified Nodularia (in: cyanobacteria) TaxID=2656917 RepID=UPI0018808478|nr:MULTISPECIES: ATP-binding protein [unclassified Nodularia (in: cyanobacteria)]MBE9198709.1 GAF domain-containing protein [Nodularia sp. LEGE 06071]MCC2694575.1 GAF domain-containing protein [Nodularia sp. LEGE 04288]
MNSPIKFTQPPRLKTNTFLKRLLLGDTSVSPQRFKLLQNFSIVSLLSFTLAMGWLTGFYRQQAVKNVVNIKEEDNVVLTKILANNLWRKYGSFFSSTKTLSDQELLADPRISQIHRAVLLQVQGSSIAKVKIFDLQGRTIFSTEFAQIGKITKSSAFQAAKSGQIVSHIGHRDTFTGLTSKIKNRHLLGSYIPIYDQQTNKKIIGVFEVYTDVTPWLHQIRSTQVTIIVKVSLILAILYILLFAFVYRADALLKKQYQELQESEVSYRLQTSDLEDTLTELQQAQSQLTDLLERSQLLNHLSTEIRNSLALESILESAVNAIFQQLKVDICTFGWYRCDTKTPLLEVVQEQRNPQLRSWLGSYQLEEFPRLFQHIFEDKIYTLDLQNPEDIPDQELTTFCESMKINLYLALPIHTEGKIGAFKMGRVDGSLAWEPDEIELLQNLATQLAIAIQQANLYQTSQCKSQELQRAYQELQQTQVQLIQSEKMSSLGQLVAGIAHEINNPVNFIYGNLEPVTEYTEALLKIVQLYQASDTNPSTEIMKVVEEVDLEFIVQDLPKTIQSMKTGALRIQDIVKSLRTFSRLDEACLKAVDLHENIDSTLMILQSQLNGQTGLPEIVLIKNYGNLPKFECYVGLLNQVFMNLLMNAIQAIEERQIMEVDPTYQGMITITTMVEPSEAVSISVQDNGIGMTLEVKARIFNPFFTTKTVGKGTGMGLPNSYQIVTNNHQGELFFDSTWGEGTIFTIRLPKTKVKNQ